MSSKRNLKYKCPFCNKSYDRASLVRHITDKHEEELPEDFTPLRYVFNYVNKKPVSYHGICTECKRETPWDENKGRYDRQCGRKQCHDSFVRRFEANMIKTKGVTRISATASGQEKMLAHRKISGTYKFQDGTEKTYVGSYELKTLEFMDKVMNIKPDDILCPGPILEYTYNGKPHMYITDFYYQPYNLIIEVKDGGDNPNTRDMPEYRAKQAAKEEFIIKHTNYNYLRLTNNNLEQLLATFANLKMELVDNSNDRVLNINEMGMAGYMPVIGMDTPNSAYIVDYMKNNVFSGESERGYALSRDKTFSSLIGRNKEGKLARTSKSILFDSIYNVYEVTLTDDMKNIIAENMDQFVPYEFLYETIFNKKMYTEDQIAVTEEAIPVIDYYTEQKYMDEIIHNRYKVQVPDDIEYNEDGIGTFTYNEAVFITCKGGLDYIIQIPEDNDSNFIKRTERYKFLESLIRRRDSING